MKMNMKTTIEMNQVVEDEKFENIKWLFDEEIIEMIGDVAEHNNLTKYDVAMDGLNFGLNDIYWWYEFQDDYDNIEEIIMGTPIHEEDDLNLVWLRGMDIIYDVED